MSKVLRALALAAVGLVIMAGPAAADPAKPGDYSSEVTGITPDIEGFTVSVFGGDSFLELEADRGVEVVVLGYEGEPYLRFLPDGGIEENLNSPATYLNAERFADVELPVELLGPEVVELEPDWDRVADGHRYAWHDHRVHWMAPNAPPAVGRGETFDWLGSVPIVVDGTPVEIDGTITYHEDLSPVPWFALAALGALIIGVVRWRYSSRWWGLAPAIVGAAATLVSWEEFSSAPASAGASAIPLSLATLATAVGIGAALVPPKVRPAMLFISLVTLGTWGIFRVSVLTNPILPTPISFTVDRSTTAAALAVALALIPRTFLEASTPNPAGESQNSI